MGNFARLQCPSTHTKKRTELTLAVPRIKTAILLPTLLLALIIALMTATCTTVGVHDPEAIKRIDFGEPEEIRFCILLDEGVSEDQARSLIAKVSEEFSLYGLVVKVPWMRPWVRHDFFMEGLMEDVWSKSLEPPCDRLLALVGRNFGDFLFGLLGMETLGAADTVTFTRGYVVARRVSLAQVFVGPEQTIVHESYHLLGCVHKLKLFNCYTHIRDLKQAKRANRARGEDFFPGLSAQGVPINTRQEADSMVHSAVKRIQAERAAGH